MIRTLLARMSQKHRTILWPDGPAPALAQRYRGLPAIDTARCPEGCRDCASVCPTEAISFPGGKPQLDLCLLYTSPSPRDRTRSRMPSSA